MVFNNFPNFRLKFSPYNCFIIPMCFFGVGFCSIAFLLSASVLLGIVFLGVSDTNRDFLELNSQRVSEIMENYFFSKTGFLDSIKFDLETGIYSNNEDQETDVKKFEDFFLSRFNNDKDLISFSTVFENGRKYEFRKDISDGILMKNRVWIFENESYQYSFERARGEDNNVTESEISILDYDPFFEEKLRTQPYGLWEGPLIPTAEIEEFQINEPYYATTIKIEWKNSSLFSIHKIRTKTPSIPRSLSFNKESSISDVAILNQDFRVVISHEDNLNEDHTNFKYIWELEHGYFSALTKKDIERALDSDDGRIGDLKIMEFGDDRNKHILIIRYSPPYNRVMILLQLTVLSFLLLFVFGCFFLYASLLFLLFIFCIFSCCSLADTKNGEMRKIAECTRELNMDNEIIENILNKQESSYFQDIIRNFKKALRYLHPMLIKYNNPNFKDGNDSVFSFNFSQNDSDIVLSESDLTYVGTDTEMSVGSENTSEPSTPEGIEKQKIRKDDTLIFQDPDNGIFFSRAIVMIVNIEDTPNMAAYDKDILRIYDVFYKYILRVLENHENDECTVFHGAYKEIICIWDSGSVLFCEKAIRCAENILGLYETKILPDMMKIINEHIRIHPQNNKTSQEPRISIGINNCENLSIKCVGKDLKLLKMVDGSLEMTKYIETCNTDFKTNVLINEKLYDMLRNEESEFREFEIVNICGVDDFQVTWNWNKNIGGIGKYVSSTGSLLSDDDYEDNYARSNNSGYEEKDEKRVRNNHNPYKLINDAWVSFEGKNYEDAKRLALVFKDENSDYPNHCDTLFSRLKEKLGVNVLEPESNPRPKRKFLQKDLERNETEEVDLDGYGKSEDVLYDHCVGLSENSSEEESFSEGEILNDTPEIEDKRNEVHSIVILDQSNKNGTSSSSCEYEDEEGRIENVDELRVNYSSSVESSKSDLRFQPAKTSSFDGDM